MKKVSQTVPNRPVSDIVKNRVFAPQESLEPASNAGFQLLRRVKFYEIPSF
jgi:hypothetical protein